MHPVLVRQRPDRQLLHPVIATYRLKQLHPRPRHSLPHPERRQQHGEPSGVGPDQTVTTPPGVSDMEPNQTVTVGPNQTDRAISTSKQLNCSS